MDRSRTPSPHALHGSEPRPVPVRLVGESHAPTRVRTATSGRRREPTYVEVGDPEEREHHVLPPEAPTYEPTVSEHEYVVPHSAFYELSTFILILILPTPRSPSI